MTKYLLITCVLICLITSMPDFASASYAVGDKVSDFTLTDSNGNQVSLQDFNGMAVLLNIWRFG